MKRLISLSLLFILGIVFLFSAKSNPKKGPEQWKIGAILFSDAFIPSSKGLKDGMASLGYGRIQFFEYNIHGDN